MTEPPFNATDYSPDDLLHVRQICLYVATVLGDLLDDIVIVGGLVPSLLISPETLPEGRQRHVGTKDLDLGLALTLLDERRYREVSSRLRKSGFGPDTNDQGNLTFQRWKYESDAVSVTIDFLIPPPDAEARPGTTKNLEEDFAAIIMPGLELVHEHYFTFRLSGETPQGEKATREIRVCGLGPFIVLKALAITGRNEPKDAYDLFYVLQNHPGGIDAAAEALGPLLVNEHCKKAIEVLTNDFQTLDHLGPRRVAYFLYGDSDEEIQAQAYALVNDLINALQ